MENDTKRIITHEWFQIVALVLTVGGLFMWNQSEIHSFQKESHAEMKDFHGRLCAFEEKYFQMMERYLEDRRGK